MCVCVFFLYFLKCSNIDESYELLLKAVEKVCEWATELRLFFSQILKAMLSPPFILITAQCYICYVTLSTNNGSLFMQSLYAVWISLFYYFHSILSLTFLHEDAFVDKVKSVLLNGNLNSNVFTQRTEPKLLVKQQILHTLTQKTWRHRGEDKNDVIN